MTKTIIWIRHGCVKQHPNHDVLTKEGELFASRLPNLLREHSIEPDVVFFDESEDRSREGDLEQTLGIPKRCSETVRGFEVPSKIYFTCSIDSDPNQLLIKFASKGQVIVVCYKTESFFRLPQIKDCKFGAYMGQVGTLKKPDRSVTNELYAKMLVTRFDGADLSYSKTIPTGIYSTNALVEARS